MSYTIQIWGSISKGVTSIKETTSVSFSCEELQELQGQHSDPEMQRAIESFSEFEQSWIGVF